MGPKRLLISVTTDSSSIAITHITVDIAAVHTITNDIEIVNKPIIELSMLVSQR